VTLFVLDNYTGKFEETEEMKPQWFALDAIPYASMWDDDAIWLPRLLSETAYLEYDFFFDENGKLMSHEKLS